MIDSGTPLCPYHNCITENEWCWECAQETYGYDECQQVYKKFMEAKIDMTLANTKKQFEECSFCKGKGRVDNPVRQPSVICPKCDGFGVIDSEVNHD